MLSIGDRAERAAGSMVSANYFDALGVRPILDEDSSRVKTSDATRIRLW